MCRSFPSQNGPSQFVSTSKVPLPKEKHDETIHTAPEPAAHEKSDSDSDFDIVDFPEVPTQPLQPNKATVSTPVMLHFPESALSDDDQEEPNKLDPEDVGLEKSVAKEDPSLNIQAGPTEAKQFVPFISPPMQSSETVSATERDSSSPPPISKMYDDHVDLQDVLAAARAAAESAERAAAAARSAASIAQLRISELSKKRSNESSVPQHHNNTIDKQNSNGDSGSASTSPSQTEGCQNNSARQLTPTSSFDSSSPRDNAHHLPQRLPSIDDEPYFSYPNLFTSQGSNIGAHSQSPRESK